MMMKYFIILLALCFVAANANPLDRRQVPDLLSACARMDTWGLSEVAKAACGAACYYKNCAVGTCVKSGGRPVCTCSCCAPGAGGGISCAYLGWK